MSRLAAVAYLITIIALAVIAVIHDQRLNSLEDQAVLVAP